LLFDRRNAIPIKTSIPINPLKIELISISNL
jgi:hypothetical protein